MNRTSEPTRRKLPRRRLLIFAAVAGAGAIVLSLTALLLLDLWVHRKFDAMAGLNIWGYRGPTVGRKPTNEYRILVLGASTVFGYGLVWSDALPAQLERKLRDTRQPYSVVNLGYNNEGTYSYQFTLRDFSYMKPDLAILYEGYTDNRGLNTTVARRESLVFRIAGYYPLLPLVASEKLMALRYGGDLDAAYRAKNAAAAARIFRPTTAAPPTAPTASQAVPSPNGDAQELRRSEAFYSEAMRNAFNIALEQGTSVLVVSPPYSGETRQQRVLQRGLVDSFNHPAVHYLDVSQVLDMHDTSVSFDGNHLTAAGNSRVADALVTTVLEIAARPGGRP